MDVHVLVAYGTKYGATAEIAMRIGQVLSDAGLSGDVLPAKRVNDLKSYNAVVLGSGVYIGQWRKDAAHLLKSFEKPLAEMPVWLFSSGPTGKGNPLELTKGWLFPKKLQPIADRIKPRDIALFGGYANAKKMSSIEKWMLSNIHVPAGDFRDWEAIASWAKAIAGELKKM